MIAYVSEESPGGKKGIYFTDPEGLHVRPVTLGDSETEVRGGAWSVYGSMYAFASNHLGTYGIYVIDVKDGTLEEVANIEGVDVQLGDVNFDGAIDVFDIIIVVNIVIEEMVPSNEEQLAADLNQDGAIDVFDIISLVSIILG